MADGLSFPALKRKLVLEKHSFLEAKEQYKCRIEGHTFNMSVELLLPECPVEKFDEYFQHSSPTSDQYCIAEVPLHMFTDISFIDFFIKQGKFSALSVGSHIDTDNCVAVLPSGVLILSLDKDTYEQMGLQGKNSAFHKKHRFFVEVDLKAKSFVPGKKFYDRVRWCLKDRLDLKFKFLISWIQKDGTDGSSKVKSYFRESGCQLKRNTMDVELFMKLKAPKVEFTSGVTEDRNKILTEACDAEAFFDWLGCVACGVECSSVSADDYLSSMGCPEPYHQVSEVVRCHWTGFISPYRIKELLCSARKLMSSSAIKAPWLALTVWGFADSPVTWSNTEHGFHLGGENFYTFVIFPDEHYWLYIALGSHDVLR